MLISLPTETKVWDEDKKSIIPSKSSINVRLNNSVLAHLKWEQQFEDSEGFDLLTAIERVQATLAKKNSQESLLKHLTIMLRILYCFIDSEDIPTFSEFAVMLGDNPTPIMEKLKIVLTENAKVSSKN